MERFTKHTFFLALVGALILGGGADASASVKTDETEAVDAVPQVTMAEATTRFRTRGRNRRRARNVELAAKRLEGVMLKPGEVLSFNDQVGERSRERGFQSAPVIAGGEIRMGQGGGVCQVSTTLHLAAMKAGLTIVEHRTHSRPAPYAPAGLDATVAWGRIDYKIANPYGYPVRLHTAVEGGRLTVTIEGAEAQAYELESETIRELEVREEIIEDATLPAGQRVVQHTGRAGQVVRVVRTDAEGNVEASRERYFPAPRVVRVGTGPAPVEVESAPTILASAQ
ncbi:MAG: VanW family protein [Deltaproteobacteria bacterium]|nr:VanW family protein [Deltaproteobacteria bacterium]